MAKRKNKNRTDKLALAGPDDLGTPEMRKHGAAVVVESYDALQRRQFKQARVTNQFAIDRLRFTGSIGNRQFEAGNRMKVDMVEACLIQKVTVTLTDAGRSKSTGDRVPGDTAMQALIRLRRAMSALDERSRLIVTMVVWEDRMSAEVAVKFGITGAERTLRAAGGDLIRHALDRLADHYGLPDADGELTALPVNDIKGARCVTAPKHQETI